MFGDTSSIPGHPHVGIASLVSFLNQRGYKVKVFDEGAENSNRKLRNLITDFAPDIIGITTFSYCYDNILKTIKRVNDITQAPIVLGGPHVSAVKGKILEDNGNVYFAIKGEGEYTFLELLESLAQKKPNFDKINGLIWRKNKLIIENSDRPLISNLDSLPFPNYEIFKLKKYPCYEIKALPILTSRGCPYNCNYCSVKLSMGRSFRARSPQNVISEMKHWYKKGFNSFDINDDCFTLDLKRAEKICDLIIKNKLKIQFQLYNGIRVDRVTPRLLKKLKRAGCTFIAYGCETGNQYILNRIKKNITLEQVRKAVNWTNEAGIGNAVNFIIGHQDETYKQALDSIEFAKSLPTNFVNFYNLVPYPGTEVYDWALKNAKFLVPKESFLKAVSYRDNSPIFETEKFTKEQREEVMKKGFALYEKKVLQFKLDKIPGSLAYYLTRIPIIHQIAQKLISFKLGWKIFNSLSGKLKNIKNNRQRDIQKEIGFFDSLQVEKYNGITNKTFETIHKIIEKFNLHGLILEADCGTGSFGKKLIQKNKNISIVGADINKKFIRKIIQQNNPRYKAVHGNLENKKLFKPNSFDSIIFPYVLHHFPSIDKVMENSHTWLKKNGIIIIIDPNGSNPILKLSYQLRTYLLKLFPQKISKYGSINKKYINLNSFLRATHGLFKILTIKTFLLDSKINISFNIVQVLASIKLLMLKIYNYLNCSPYSGSDLIIIAKKNER